MAYAPLATGLLSGAYTPGQLPPEWTLWGGRRREQFAQTLTGRAAAALATVRDVAERSGVTVAQIALKWVISHPEVTVAISGTDTEAQLDENLGALDAQISPEDYTRLNEVSTGLGMFLDGPQYGPAPRK
jgi:aryl-alcohol dehydrogenase-like predicted oxidoreductase